MDLIYHIDDGVLRLNIYVLNGKCWLSLLKYDEMNELEV